MSLKSVNAAYLAYLHKYPLLTKSVTAGVLNGLNELIASIISKDFTSLQLGLNTKVVKMVIYGSCILTPISHNLYGLLNRVYGSGKQLSPALKVLQILTSLVTISPVLSGIFTSWLSLINEYKYEPSKLKGMDFPEKLETEAKKMVNIVLKGLRTNYFRILKGSVTTNCICLIIAQNWLAPELWVVFFNFVYFALNTYQNTRVKRRAKEAKQVEESK